MHLPCVHGLALFFLRGSALSWRILHSPLTIDYSPIHHSLFPIDFPPPFLPAGITIYGIERMRVE